MHQRMFDTAAHYARTTVMPTAIYAFIPEIQGCLFTSHYARFSIVQETFLRGTFSACVGSKYRVCCEVPAWETPTATPPAYI